MTKDERAIRGLVEQWITASEAGDTQTVLNLMADDVLFMVPGQKPFGKEAFAAASENLSKFRTRITSDIQEIQVAGNWAYLRNYLTVELTPLESGEPVQRSGYTLTILRKRWDGSWELARDANLVTGNLVTKE